MNVFSAIKERRSVRDYGSRKIEDEKLMSIILTTASQQSLTAYFAINQYTYR